MDRQMDKLDHRLARYEDDADAKVKEVLDKAMKKSISKMLNMCGTATQRMLKPANCPKRLEAVADYMFHGLWPEIASNLEESIMISSGYSSEKLRAERTASGGRAGVHRVDVDIYARNAVNADYFRLCPERFGVRPTTGVILLDMEPAMGMSGEPVLGFSSAS